jgi:UDP-glucose 4-epimerase
MRIFAEIYGLETVSLRYFNVFGPRQDPKSEYAAVIPKFMTAAIRREQPVVFGDGEQTRDFCYIDNVVRANVLAATTPRKLRGEVLNIACGERISLNQLLKHLGELSGARLVAEHRPARAGDVRDSLASVEAAREALGYEPLVDVRAGLKKTFEAFARFTR